MLGLCHLTHFEEKDTYKIRSEETHELRVCGRHTVRQAVGTGTKILVEVWTRLFDDFLDDFVDNFANEVPSDDYDGFDFSRKEEPRRVEYHCVDGEEREMDREYGERILGVVHNVRVVKRHGRVFFKGGHG